MILGGLLLSLTILGVGMPIYQIVHPQHNSPNSGGKLAFQWLYGSILISWLLFFWTWFNPLSSTIVYIIGTIGLLSLGLSYIKQIKEKTQNPAQSPLKSTRSSTSISISQVFFILLIIAQIAQTTFAASVTPVSTWDAWVNWASKTNILLIEGTLAPGLYGNASRLATNLDYPLMLPLLEVWAYHWGGTFGQQYPGIISTLFLVCLLLIFYHTIRRLVPITAALGVTALLALTPWTEYFAFNGLADIPLAALVLASFSQLTALQNQLHHHQHRALWPQLASLIILGGALPWLKNEGWLWLGILSLCLIIILIQQQTPTRLPISKIIIISSIHLILVIILPLSWQLYLNWHGTYRFTFMPLTLNNFWLNSSRLLPLTLRLIKRLIGFQWYFMGIVISLIVLYQRHHIFKVRNGWLILPASAYIGLISLTYVFSRFNPYLAHFNNSIDRLIWQAYPLILWWLVSQSVNLGLIKTETFIESNRL